MRENLSPLRTNPESYSRNMITSLSTFINSMVRRICTELVNTHYVRNLKYLKYAGIHVRSSSLHVCVCVAFHILC